jgi:hypothetical protein
MGRKSLWFCKSRLYFRFETVCTGERIPSQPLSFRQKLDANGDDINATGASNFLSVVSRLGVNFKGPNVWGAKASGKLEGDFFGNTQESIGLFRLRHAYAQLAWEKSSLTLGQTWYPSFVPEVFPELPISARELCLILLAGLVKLDSDKVYLKSFFRFSRLQRQRVSSSCSFWKR